MMRPSSYNLAGLARVGTKVVNPHFGGTNPLLGPHKNTRVIGTSEARDKHEDQSDKVNQILTASISVNELMRAKAIETLAHNSELQHLLSEFVTAIVNGLENLKKKEDLAKLFYLVRAINALHKNPSFSLRGQACKLLLAMGKLVVSSQLPTSCKEGDHIRFRNHVGELIGRICDKYGDAYLPDRLVSAFYDRFARGDNMSSRYGAIAGIIGLGPKIVKEWITPQLGYISGQLDAVNGSPLVVEMANKIRSKIVAAVGPQLKSLQHLPNLGSFRQYFQKAGYIPLPSDCRAKVKSSYQPIHPSLPASDLQSHHLKPAGGVLGGGTAHYHPNVYKLLINCMSPTHTTRAGALEHLTKCIDGNKYLPGIVSSIAKGVQISCDKEEYNLSSLFRYMRIVKALVANKNLATEGHLAALITAVGKTIVCGRIYGQSEEGSHFDLRLLTGRLLSQILKTKSVSTNLKMDIANGFANLLNQRTLVTIYGSLVGLRAMGLEIVEKFLPNKVGFIVAKIDTNHKTFTDIVEAETLRTLLLEIVEPILPSMKNTAELGSLWSYFKTQPCTTSHIKSSGDKLSPPPKRSKAAVGQTGGCGGFGGGQTGGAAFDEEQTGGASFGGGQTGRAAFVEEQTGGASFGGGQTDRAVFGGAGFDANNHNGPEGSGQDNSAIGLSSTLHIYGLKDWITEEMVRVNFSRHGNIAGIYMNKRKFFTHVKFSTHQEAERCLQKLQGKKYGIFKEAKIDWATTNKFRKEDTEYYKFCEEFGLCYNYNVHDLGCSLANCKGKHCCLFCFELFNKEEPHPSRYNCPNEKEGYLKFGPRNQ